MWIVFIPHYMLSMDKNVCQMNKRKSTLNEE